MNNCGSERDSIRQQIAEAWLMPYGAVPDWAVEVSFRLGPRHFCSLVQAGDGWEMAYSKLLVNHPKLAIWVDNWLRQAEFPGGNDEANHA